MAALWALLSHGMLKGLDRDWGEKLRAQSRVNFLDLNIFLQDRDALLSGLYSTSKSFLRNESTILLHGKLCWHWT